LPGGVFVREIGYSRAMSVTQSRAVVQLFSNPSAGRRPGNWLDALVRAFEAEGARVIRSVSAGGPPVIAPEATHVCVAGGDGTVRHVASAVARSGRDVRMSIYPAGTVNLLAMEAGYPKDPGEFARLVLSDVPSRNHYPVAFGDSHFFACLSVGPDSLAVARVSPRLKRMAGRLAYAWSFLRMLARWPRHRITLSADGRTVECEAFYVAKGRYYAGRWSFAAQARVHEPVIHVVALRRARRRDYLRFASALAAHSVLRQSANVEAFSCTALRAESAEPLPIQADGDIVGMLPVTLAVAETPLRFC
jgi:diacylglycerol kinase family enzyme